MRKGGRFAVASAFALLGATSDKSAKAEARPDTSEPATMAGENEDLRPPSPPQALERPVAKIEFTEI